jgi:hypothetical protein
VKSNALCIKVFYEHFVGRHLKLPTTEEAIKEAKLFSATSGFPPIIFGAIDGCHIVCMPPKKQTILFRNRHNTLSLNVLVMGGASGRVYFVKSNCPGSFNDNRILRQSVLWEVMEDGEWRPFPGAIIIGDFFILSALVCTILLLSALKVLESVSFLIGGKMCSDS